MLDPNITMNLDHLANLGILDYDAAAHIAGCRPRYAGNPNNPFIPPVVHTPLDGALFNPAPDTFNGKSLETPSKITDSLFPNAPDWKKWLFGAVVVLGGMSILRGVKNFKLSNLFAPIKKLFGKSGTTASNVASNSSNFIKNSWKKVVGMFSKAKP